jgi:hypothetical protein
MKTETRLYLVANPYGDVLNPHLHKKSRSLPEHAWHIGRSVLPWLAYVVTLAVLPLSIEKNFGAQGLLYYIPCLFFIGFATLGLAIIRRRR